MPEAKLNRFELAGQEERLDSKGHVVRPRGCFYGDPDVLDMYLFCSTLRLSNRVFLRDDLESDYILDVVEASLYDRLKEADCVGPGLLLEKILRLMDSFYSSDIRFRARRRGRVSGFERMQRLMVTFNQLGFRNFKLSGDGVTDAYSFLCLFGI
jgi:hypothetical protein